MNLFEKRRWGFPIITSILFVCLVLAGCPDPSTDDGLAPPAAPAAPTVTAGNAQLTVSWTAVSGATAYEVWNGTTNVSADATKFGSDVTTTSATITGLTNDTTYYVWIKAKNNYGTSGFSPAANGTPVAPAETKAGAADELAHKLLILQVFGDGSGRGDQVSHHFIELYNTTDAVINLDGYSVQYAAGNNGDAPTEDFPWTVVDLSGKTIPSKTSFLILGSKNGEDSRLMIPDNSGDINDGQIVLSNRAFKVALIKGTDELTVANPFNMDGNGAKAAGYVDMVAALNTPGTDVINGYEGSSADNLPRHSAQESVRRISLTDTDDNSVDFESVRYGGPNGGTSVQIPDVSKDVLFEFYRPKNTTYGDWDPVDPPLVPTEINSVIIGDSSLTIGWVSVRAATAYEVWYNTSNNTTTATQFGGDVTGLTTTITGLTNGTEYFVWIKVKKGSDTSAFGPSAKGTPLGAGSVSADYSTLKLNEVSGPGENDEKFYELINIGTEDIDLDGFKIYYNANDNGGQALPSGKGNLTWTGTAGQIIEAGELFLLLGRYNASSNPTGAFSTGLTGQRNLIITLEDPLGNVIDQCVRAEDTGDYAITDKSYSRIPDGTGPFYFTTPSPGIKQGTSTIGLTKVPQAPAPYHNLVLTEVSGNNKYVEIYNSSTAAISLTGVKLQRNDGASEWTGGASDSIPAGAYRIFLFNSYTPAELADNAAYVGWTVSSGISSGQVLKVAIVDPDGNPVDVFIRGDLPLPAWQNTTGVTQDTTNSYSRMSDGSWAFAAPTPGAASGTKVADIVSPGYLTVQP